MRMLMGVFFGVVIASTARSENPLVAIETSMGMIKVELLEEQAPVTVKNFLEYVDEKFYDNTIFHRVLGKENSGRDFVVQCGGWVLDPNASIGMREKATKPPIINEASNGLKNERGTIAMARTKDPNSATSQFYFNVVDNSRRLDKEFAADKIGYCVFGKVVEGIEVIDKIKSVKTSRKNEEHTNVPTEPVLLKSIKRVNEKKKEDKP